MSDAFDYKPPFGFDIRIKPDTDEAQPEAEAPCEWEGCALPGSCRAPVAPDRPGQFWHLCLDHARAHNQSWDFFKGMNEEQVRAFCDSVATGHRPTWRMGVNGAVNGPAAERVRSQFRPGQSRPGSGRFTGAERPGDPYGLFHDYVAGARARASATSAPVRRHLSRLQRGALEDLGLDESAGLNEVRARYKELVKRFHPDANGGDRGAEDSLRRVIRAYQMLRTSGFR